MQHPGLISACLIFRRAGQNAQPAHVLPVCNRLGPFHSPQRYTIWLGVVGQIALDGQDEEPAALERRGRINDLLSFLTLVDSLAQRFFESHNGLRDAVDLLAKKS